MGGGQPVGTGTQREGGWGVKAVETGSVGWGEVGGGGNKGTQLGI